MAQSHWIAFELHDGLLQWVIGAHMHLESMLIAIKERKVVSPSPELEESLTQILNYLNQAADEGRQLIHFIEGLPSGTLVNAVDMLAVACDQLARKARAGRTQVAFQGPVEQWPLMPQPVAWAIFRIVQQSALNAVRHSGARTVTIRLSSTTDNKLQALVVDDGCGFDPNLDRPGHFGLKSMRQRAREAGFSLEVESRPNGGGSRVALLIDRDSIPSV